MSSLLRQFCYTCETCKTFLLYQRKKLLYKYINLTETYEENSETSFLGWGSFGVQLWTWTSFVLKRGEGGQNDIGWFRRGESGFRILDLFANVKNE